MRAISELFQVRAEANGGDAPASAQHREEATHQEVRAPACWSGFCVSRGLMWCTTGHTWFDHLLG